MERRFVALAACWLLGVTFVSSWTNAAPRLREPAPSPPMEAEQVMAALAETCSFSWADGRYKLTVGQVEDGGYVRNVEFRERVGDSVRRIDARVGKLVFDAKAGTMEMWLWEGQRIEAVEAAKFSSATYVLPIPRGPKRK